MFICDYSLCSSFSVSLRSSGAAAAPRALPVDGFEIEDQRRSLVVIYRSLSRGRRREPQSVRQRQRSRLFIVWEQTVTQTCVSLLSHFLSGEVMHLSAARWAQRHHSCRVSGRHRELAAVCVWRKCVGVCVMLVCVCDYVGVR